MIEATGVALNAADWTWLAVAERELFLFAAFWLVLGALDELAVDGIYGILRLTGKARTPVFDAPVPETLSGRFALFIPAWQESRVIATTVAQIGSAWPQAGLTIFVGVYRNDPATGAAVRDIATGDLRVRPVEVERDGPTTKADCLNHLYAAMEAEEHAGDFRYRAIVLQDAEDMVHPAGLALIDHALADFSMVQLPVRPALDPGLRFVSGHYADEFSESHAKAMVVRQALGAPLPSAGVGCAIAREALRDLALDRARNGAAGPFACDSLTEDYELGFKIERRGLQTRFVRARDGEGRLIATESFFPNALGPAARQKARWLHGIAFQGWDRLGWDGGWADRWMKLRDRRGPLAALVLAVAYLLLAVEAAIVITGVPHTQFENATPILRWAAIFLLVSLLWRTALRALFVGREYGWGEALRSIVRVPVANVIAIMAGWRGLAAYGRALRGQSLTWDKTEHLVHPSDGPAERSASR